MLRIAHTEIIHMMKVKLGGYHKKIFLGPLPGTRHWVEFWLHVTVYTVYTWLKKRRLNFIAFHFTFLCSHGNPPHASRYEREEELMINSFKKTNKRFCFLSPPPLPTLWEIGHWSRVSAELLPAPVCPHGGRWKSDVEKYAHIQAGSSFTFRLGRSSVPRFGV